MSNSDENTGTTCELAAAKILLLRRGLYDKANDAMDDPEPMILWTTGGTIKAGGPMAEAIRSAIEYNPNKMASFIAEAAAFEL